VERCARRTGTIWFDQIIRYMYEQRRDVWEAEQRPCGLLYRPPGARCGYTWSRNYGVNWPLWTPDWMRNEPVCLKKLRLIRWLYAASLLGTVVLMFTQPSNQAMQLTASKPAVYACGVCRRASMLRGMHRGLAAADLVSR
jgi:hypothetical protein